MKLIARSFLTIPARCDESVFKDHRPVCEIPEKLALLKAQEISAGNPGSIVIGCDTGVFINDTMLGKPENTADSINMLRMLSGTTHTVITGCALISDTVTDSFSVRTQVTFYDLTDEEISRYVKTGEPSDKAGGYGIQGYGSLLVRKIDGDYYNVVGLPVAQLSRHLSEFIML